jgi:DNA-binding PadR family transcriptional regulator
MSEADISRNVIKVSDKGRRKFKYQFKEIIMGEQNQQTALTEAVYYILLSLDTPLHGYGIMQQVREMSGERVSLGAGTLYGAINTLVEKGWIIPFSGPADARKKEYQITQKGRQVLHDELSRLEELVASGKRILNEGEDR